MSTSYVFTNLESTNPEFVSRNLPCFLKTEKNVSIRKIMSEKKEIDN